MRSSVWMPGLLAVMAISATAFAERSFTSQEKRQLRRIATMDKVAASGTLDYGRVDGQSGKGKKAIWRMVSNKGQNVTEVGKHYHVSRYLDTTTTRIKIADAKRIPGLVLRLMRDGQLRRGTLKKGDLVTYGIEKGSKQLDVRLWRPESDLPFDDTDNEWELLDSVTIPIERSKRIWNKDQKPR